MGIISIEQEDRLYWLGRYVERTYTTLRLYCNRYDIMIDMDENSYGDFCDKLDIPNIYQSAQDFIFRYGFDPENENSIFCNLLRAYDNAIELREMIHSEALSYIQLAIYDIKKAEISPSPIINLQKAMDNLLAFWGMIDDGIDDEMCRNTIKVGKRIERIDLYGRLHQSRTEMVREFHRMAGRIDRSLLEYNHNTLQDLRVLVESEELDYYNIVMKIEHILEREH